MRAHHLLPIALAIIMIDLALAACAGPAGSVASPDAVPQTETADIPPLVGEAGQAGIALQVAGPSVEFRLQGGAEFAPAEEGQMLAAGAEVRTGSETHAFLRLSSDDVLILGPQSTLAVVALPPSEGGEDAFQFSLISGQAIVSQGSPGEVIIEVQDSGGGFLVHLPVGGEGARLAEVSANGGGEPSAACLAGVCVIEVDGHESLIPPGESVTIVADEESAARRATFKWSRDNGSVVTALAAAGIEPGLFENLVLDAHSDGSAEVAFATVHRLEGAPQAEDGLQLHPATDGEVLASGHSLHTDEDSRAALHLQDGAVLDIREHSTVHFGGSAGREEDDDVHIALESGEFYLIHTNQADPEHEWVIEIPGGAEIHIKPDEDRQVGVHVSYDSANDDLQVTVLAGEAQIQIGDETADLTLRKRTEVKDSHDRYANIETNMTVSGVDEDEYENWEDALMFSDVSTDAFDLESND
ncbi:MAG: FecR domain-containing protein [Chloroflexi bacterium]|nr:FecR domain-containing protein [Chloroflexota bacterium]